MIKLKDKGGFEIQDIFMFFVFGIMLFVFISIFSPITALFNFDAISNGAIIELIINLFSVVLLTGFIASYIKKWNQPSM